MCKNLDGENLANFWSVVQFHQILVVLSFPSYGTGHHKFTNPQLFIDAGSANIIPYIIIIYSVMIQY